MSEQEDALPLISGYRLPPGWVLASPDDVSDGSRNALAIGPFGSNLKVSDYETDGVPLVFVRNIRADRFTGDDCKFIADTKAKELEAHKVVHGDILITKMGDPPGDAAIYPLEASGVITADCIKLSPHPLVDSKYLLWMMRSDVVRSQVLGLTKGVAQLKVSLGRFRNSVLVPIAPRGEQERIVAAVEEQLSHLTAGIKSLERARRNLQRMRAAVLSAAVSGRLVPQESGDEPVDAVLERELGIRVPILAPRPDIPESWAWLPVGLISAVQGGIQKQPKRRPAHNPRPFLRVANVLRNRLDLGEVHAIEVFAGELDRYRLQPGDLLVVEGNGSPDQIGRSALWCGQIEDCVHQNHLIRVRPSRFLHPEFLNLYWNSPLAMRHLRSVASSTSGLYTLSTQKVKAVPIPVPPIAEQERIVREVDRIDTVIVHNEETVRASLKRSEALRRTLLSQASRGRLVPQDSSEEPASALLERIAATRLVSSKPKRRTRRNP